MDLGTFQVSAEEIVEFARRYDPQPFHVDPEAAVHSAFGGLVASGWHTAALYMRRFAEGVLLRSASMGSPGVDEVRWVKPVRPGDTLRARVTVEACIPSRSKPDRGIVKTLGEVFNQQGERVMYLRAAGILGRRPRASPPA